MAMYYYASKLSAIACGTRCKQTVLQKSRGQRDRDKYSDDSATSGGGDGNDEDDDEHQTAFNVSGIGAYTVGNLVDDLTTNTKQILSTTAVRAGPGAGSSSGLGLDGAMALLMDGMRYRRRHSEQSDTYGFHNIEVSTEKSSKTTFTGYGIGSANMASDAVEYDVPRNAYNLRSAHADVNYENSVLGSGGIMYINGKIVSGPMESLIDTLIPTNLMDFDKEFVFAFLLSSRLFLRPHELLGKLLSSVPDSESLESLVALLAEWTNKFPYDYRDERMMNHLKHIVARCSNTRLEAVVSEILSALLKRLTDLEIHEEGLRACQTSSTNDKPESTNILDCPTASQYAQILCRLEKKLAKHIGPEEFLQCSSNILLDKQKKWDQPTASGAPPGAQDPKKTCNLETYLDWSARLRLFVCNEILRCSGIRDRSKTVELWSGVAQYCLLVGNYNSATAILETLESPPIARLKITWSNLQVTCQQLDCMQRHAEGHGDLWQKQATVLNENHQQQQHQHHQQQQQYQQQHEKTELPAVGFLSSTSTSASISASPSIATTTTTASAMDIDAVIAKHAAATSLPVINFAGANMVGMSSLSTSSSSSPLPPLPPAHQSPMTTTGIISCINATDRPTSSTTTTQAASSVSSPTATTSPTQTTTEIMATINVNNNNNINNTNPTTTIAATRTGTAAAPTTTLGMASATPTTRKATSSTAKPNDWVVIPVFADIVKLALAGREDCLQRLPNGHINIVAFDRMAAIVGAFTKHMHAVKSPAEMLPGEYEMFCAHMQKTSQLNESELMMASFDCEEPNNAEKLMYDLN